MKIFRDYLDKFVQLSNEEFDQFLLPIIKIKKYEKKEFLIKAGEVENNFNFILIGLARKYYKKGKQEIITQISSEGHIIHCQESFHSRQKAEYTIETIEPCTILSITFDDLEKAFASSQKMERLGRKVITFSMVIKDRWQLQMVKMTPRERFINFVTNNSDLIQRVPQKFLASYLNIKPETFSRFKHLIKEQTNSVKKKSVTH